MIRGSWGSTAWRVSLLSEFSRHVTTFPERRWALTLVVAAAVVILGAGELLAVGDWPPFEPNPAPQSDFRGPGMYLSTIKIVIVWLLFLAWVKSTDWVNTDMQELNLEQLDYLRWNPIIFGTFVAAFVLMWLIPFFWIGVLLLLIAYVLPLTSYVIFRNSLVVASHRVLTPEHLRFWFADRAGTVGVKVTREKAGLRESGPPVSLFAHGADERTNNARLLLARQSPGLLILRELIAEALACRATAIMLDYTQRGAAVNVKIDSVWIPRSPKERELADPALEALKTLCGLNPKDRQNQQLGSFAIEHASTRRVAKFASQGTPSGERVLMQFEEDKIHFKTLDDLGMRVKMQGQVKELLEAEKGFLLFSAVPSGGLRNTVDVALRVCDRFVREFVALEEASNRYPVVENIAVMTYNAANEETPTTALPKLLRTQPHVIVVRDLVNADTVDMLCGAAADKLVISAIRAKDCAEALLRVLALGVPPDEFAQAVTAVVGQRLVRKLCSNCMEAYSPPAEVLHQLGIPVGRIDAFYRPRQFKPDEKVKPCEVCGGIGYFGRTAIFELLVLGDAVRKVLAAKPNLDLLRKAARKDGMKSLQEEGVLLVAKGVTSLPELIRVLKQ